MHGDDNIQSGERKWMPCHSHTGCKTDRNIIDEETWRQFNGIELIESEHATARDLPNASYYGRNEYIDEPKVLWYRSTLKAFNLDPVKRGIGNLSGRTYSGLTANIVALPTLIQLNDRLMQRWPCPLSTSNLSPIPSIPPSTPSTTKPFDSQAQIFKPGHIFRGRDWDYAELKKTTEKESAWLMADIAHTSGLIAAQGSTAPSSTATSSRHQHSQDPPWPLCRSHLLQQGSGERKRTSRSA
ncbi:pyridoxal phosphate-dependent transferase [Crucibulum laeve]|uniref:Pyridoxal phosphate-dependent transferase n=1 Tax=Crucibulum laeve TaxID=68775 RepID=A0A5C3M811_9AGAR|nr:pyridoxal phosphate-dependent transferase [Crucibulum laeve]